MTTNIPQHEQSRRQQEGSYNAFFVEKQCIVYLLEVTMSLIPAYTQGGKKSGTTS